MDLVALRLGPLQFARDQDGRSPRIDLHSVSPCTSFPESKQLLKHFDDIVVGVVLVVEKDDVIEDFQFVLGCRIDFGQRHRCFT